jgi:multiple sugar transport system ATP-binding protein
VAGQRLRWPGVPSGRLATLVGRPLVLAARPEHLREASGDSREQRLRAVCTRLERLGTQTLVTCAVDAPAVAVAGEPAPAPGAAAELVARFRPQTPVRLGDHLQVVVDAGAVHLFDPATGEAVWHGG